MSTAPNRQANHSSKRVILSTNRRSNSTNQVNSTPNPHTFGQHKKENAYRATENGNEIGRHKDNKTVIIEVVENQKRAGNEKHRHIDSKGKFKETVDNKNAIIEINYGQAERPGVASGSSNHN